MFEGETIQLAELLKYPDGTVFSFVRKLGAPSAPLIKTSSDRGLIHYRPLVAPDAPLAHGWNSSPQHDWGAQVGPEQQSEAISPLQRAGSWVTVYSKDELLTMLDDLMTGIRLTRNVK